MIYRISLFCFLFFLLVIETWINVFIIFFKGKKFGRSKGSSELLESDFDEQVKVNSATMDLLKIPGIGEKMAHYILSLRKNGPLSFEMLQNIPKLNLDQLMLMNFSYDNKGKKKEGHEKGLKQN